MGGLKPGVDTALVKSTSPTGGLASAAKATTSILMSTASAIGTHRSQELHPPVSDGAGGAGSAWVAECIGQCVGMALAAMGARLLVAIWTPIKSPAQPRSGSRRIMKMMSRRFTRSS